MNDTQDNKWDKLLHIKTMGRDDSQSDQYRYPYEPTPYSVLQRLANTGLIRKNNMLLDYGCGKGRVDFFLSYQTRCRCLGVEYDERIYEKVMENKKEAVSKERVSFSLANAEEFQLPEQIDRIYFFNPFSYDDLAAAYLCVVLIDIIFIWHLPYSSLRAASLLCLRFAAGTSSVNCLMIAA